MAHSTRTKTEARSIASSLIDSNTIDGLKPTDYDQALLGLRAIRHQSMLKQDKPLQTRVDTLILDLQDRKNPPRSACPPASVIYTRSAALAITPEERTYLNQKIDLLLSGDYLLDSLDPCVISKFELLLRERKPRLTANHRYDKAAQVDRNLEILSQLREVHRKRVCDTEHLRELISDLQASLDAVEARRSQREAEYSKVHNRQEDDRRRAYDVIEEEHSLRLAELSEELENIEMGLTFHPSARLCDLRTVQAKLARISAFLESAAARDIADAAEAAERTAFDAEMRRAHALRARAAEEDYFAKMRAHEAFWLEKVGAVERAHAKSDEDMAREAARYRKRIAELEQQIADAPDMDDPVTPPRRARSVLRRHHRQVEPREHPPPVPLDVETGIYEEDESARAAGALVSGTGNADGAEKGEDGEAPPCDADGAEKVEDENAPPGDADAELSGDGES
jgi:hypothetical protein